MKSNAELQKDVQDEISGTSLLNPAEIGVTVKDGLVTLTGVVDVYSKKLAAENAAKKVKGVKAVVGEITVKYRDSKISDTEIATTILIALKENREVPDSRIAFGIENGVVTLKGEVDWKFQSKAAEETIKFLPGVELVFNQISISSKPGIAVEKKAVETAIGSNANINNKNITVNAFGHVVTLKGSVSSLLEKEEVGKLAWCSPGVVYVKNDLVVEYDE